MSVGLLASATLAAGMTSDLHVRSQLHAEQASLRRADGRLAATMHDLHSTRAALATTRSNLAVTLHDRGTLEVELGLVEWELTGAKSNLATANQSLSTQQQAITTLGTCLAGVERALNQISVGNQSGAVNSLSGVTASCQAVDGGGVGGPVFPFDFPDPDIVRVGTSYYGYATNSATGNIQMIESADLVHWRVLGDALAHLPAWARPGATWAPGVFAVDGHYVLFYATAQRSSGKECISVAVATRPQGPFLDSSTAPVVCQLALGGSLDPSPFLDAGGTPYLTWKSQGAGGQPPTLWSQRLSADGTAPVGAATALLRPAQSWEGGVVEGPTMVLAAGQYFLFYSANQWNGSHYAIGVARCAGPSGPCTRPLPGPLLASQPAFVSPGGPSVFTDPQGELWLAFHGYLPGAVGYPHNRLLFLRPLAVEGGVPVVGSAP